MLRGNTSEAQLSFVLDQIYQVPVSEAGWSAALTAAADFVGATSSDLNFFDAKFLSYKRWEHARIDVDTVSRYATSFMSDMRNVHPRMPLTVRTRQDDLFVDSDVWSQTHRNRVPYFAEVFRPAGWNDAVIGIVQEGHLENDLIVLGSYYARNSGAPSQQSRDRVRMLLPHLRRACTTDEKLRHARRECRVLAEALDFVPEAVALLDRDGRVRRANRAAQALFSTGALPLTHDERLALPLGETASALAIALTQCASAVWTADRTGTGPVAPIVVTQPAGGPLVLTLEPLPRDLVGAFGSVAMLFISNPAARPLHRFSALRSTFGLTSAEAQLVQSLSEGESLKEYAVRLDLSYETARTYLRRAMEKTGARRQSDLVRITSALR